MRGTPSVLNRRVGKVQTLPMPSSGHVRTNEMEEDGLLGFCSRGVQMLLLMLLLKLEIVLALLQLLVIPL
jgi:hypothetical protein